MARGAFIKIQEVGNGKVNLKLGLILRGIESLNLVSEILKKKFA